MNKKVVFITGTPGVGKTSIATYLNKKLNEKFNSTLIKINDIAIGNDLIQGEDIDRGYKIVDIDGLDKLLSKIINENNNSYSCDDLKIYLVEGHLSHFCSDCDKVIVLRLDPKLLEERLRTRSYCEDKVQENLEAEALAVCTVESFERHGDIVDEIDTTNMSIEEIAIAAEDVIFDRKRFPPGGIDFMDWLLS